MRRADSLISKIGIRARVDRKTFGTWLLAWLAKQPATQSAWYCWRDILMNASWSNLAKFSQIFVGECAHCAIEWQLSHLWSANCNHKQSLSHIIFILSLCRTTMFREIWKFWWQNNNNIQRSVKLFRRRNRKSNWENAVDTLQLIRSVNFRFAILSGQWAQLCCEYMLSVYICETVVKLETRFVHWILQTRNVAKGMSFDDTSLMHTNFVRTSIVLSIYDFVWRHTSEHQQNEQQNLRDGRRFACLNSKWLAKANVI